MPIVFSGSSPTRWRKEALACTIMCVTGSTTTRLSVMLLMIFSLNSLAERSSDSTCFMRVMSVTIPTEPRKMSLTMSGAADTRPTRYVPSLLLNLTSYPSSTPFHAGEVRDDTHGTQEDVIDHERRGRYQTDEIRSIPAPEAQFVDVLQTFAAAVQLFFRRSFRTFVHEIEQRPAHDLFGTVPQHSGQPLVGEGHLGFAIGDEDPFPGDLHDGLIPLFRRLDLVFEILPFGDVTAVLDRLDDGSIGILQRVGADLERK